MTYLVFCLFYNPIDCRQVSSKESFWNREGEGGGEGEGEGKPFAWCELPGYGVLLHFFLCLKDFSQIYHGVTRLHLLITVLN